MFPGKKPSFLISQVPKPNHQSCQRRLQVVPNSLNMLYRDISSKLKKKKKMAKQGSYDIIAHIWDKTQKKCHRTKN
jgi:hypothetical protein